MSCPAWLEMVLRSSEGRLLCLLGIFIIAPPTAAADVLEEVLITTSRLPPLESDAAYGITRLRADDLTASPHLRLDETLRQAAGFSLFRRSSSRSAHPTTQGATLRGLGPNGAGRALVLLDGIPQNDPFGGWVMWSALPQAFIEDVTLYRGGGAGPFGAGALSGVIDIASADPWRTGIAAQVRYGSFHTWDASLAARVAVGRTALSADIAGYDSEGFYLLPKHQRGPVDVPAAATAYSARLGVDVQLAETTRLSSRLSAFHDDRTNGILLADNRSKGWDASLRLVHDPDGKLAASVAIYVQDRNFRSAFAGVNNDRSAATLTLDQFDVPGRSIGLRTELRYAWQTGQITRLGGDGRWVDGETNEYFRNLGAGFTRQRVAGGEQVLGGLYLEHSATFQETITLTGGIRVDYWRKYDGRRLESDIASGDMLLREIFPDAGEWLTSGRLGVRWEATDFITLRAAAYTGFRTPTINELYRPFRVGNDITEANAGLDKERLKGWEIGAVWAPRAEVSLDITFFTNRLEDAIGNVTIGVGPGVFPTVGFVPAGGVLRQRQNIERMSVKGAELSANINLSEHFQVQSSYAYNDGEIRRSLAAPDLVGNRLAQAPRHSGMVTADWRAFDQLRLRGVVRYGAKQFEDDANSRRLNDYIALDGYAGYRLSDAATLFIQGENLTNSEIQSAIDGNGIITRATPRSIVVGVNLRL